MEILLPTLDVVTGTYFASLLKVTFVLLYAHNQLNLPARFISSYIYAVYFLASTYSQI